MFFTLRQFFLVTLFSFLFQHAWCQKDGDAVRIINKPGSPYMEIRNGLLGLVIPKESSFDPKNPKNTLAPIQSVIYHDGVYSDETPNYLQSVVPPTSLKVTVVTNMPEECVVVVRYTFNKPEFISYTGKYKGGDAGPGYYQTTIDLKRGSRSALMEEESNYDVSYEFKISNGLQPDHARYRGWSSSAVQYGYEPSGVVYRPEDQRPPLDATVDLHYDKDATFTPMSMWDPAGGELNTGRYWQVFNNAAAASANLIGFFQGKPSRLIGARSIGTRLLVRSADKPTEKGLVQRLSNNASIQVFLIRRGPDNVWYPKKRYQWGLFVSTKSDLLPPDQYQPIEKEMNAVSGLASRIDEYAKKQAIPVPAFFDAAFYMPATKIQALITKLKTDLTFYQTLNHLDPYFKPVADAWRFPDSAQSAIKNVIRFGEELKNTYKNGDGIHAFPTQYWKGSLIFKRITLEMACLFADKTIIITPAQKEAMLQLMRMMARIEWDNDNVPFFDSAGVNFGPANMSYQYKNNGRNFFAMLFAKDPEFNTRAKTLLEDLRYEIPGAIYENGSSIGSPHYSQATIDPILFTMLQLKQAGVANLFAEQKTRIYKFIDFYSALLTPPSVRFSGNRKLISFGDGSEESATTFGLLASGIAESDPVLSKKLYGILDNGTPRLSLFGDVALAIDLEGNYPNDFQSASSNYSGYLSHFRTGINSENETAAWVINGEGYFDHRNDDRGEAAIYALKAPLSLSRSCFYYPRADDARIRSVVIPEDEFPEWNKANQPVSSKTSKGPAWFHADQLEFAKLGNSAVSMSKMNTKDKEWYRQAVMIDLKEDQPIIVFYDSVNNNKPNIWSMLFMSQDAVNTPAGDITPVDKTYNVSGSSPQLPEATQEKNMNAGLEKFSFTGQDWPQKVHSTGGINWDMYAVTNSATSFTLSQWTNLWQNSQEVDQFRVTMQKQYSETQQILRVKSAAPFFHVLLPYFKGSDPYKNKVQLAAGKMRIQYGNGQLLLTATSYLYSGIDKIVAASFSTQSFSGKGIEISGGIAEVEIINGDIKIRVHGNSGKRIINLPFAVQASGKNNEVQLTSKNNATQVIIDYKSKGIDILSSEQGYTEYVFKKKM
jgi:hypothetical protein